MARTVDVARAIYALAQASGLINTAIIVLAKAPPGDLSAIFEDEMKLCITTMNAAVQAISIPERRLRLELEEPAPLTVEETAARMGVGVEYFRKTYCHEKREAKAAE